MYNHSLVFSLVVASYSSNISNTVQPMNNGIHVPSVGLGTFMATNEEELTAALNQALKDGYRHFDTASLYENEHIIGRVLREWITSKKIKRRDLFITTQLHPMDMQPESVESALKTSLSKLQLKYIDLYLIHMPVALKKNEDNSVVTAPTDLLGIWKKMEDQVLQRRARSIGLSNFSEEQIKKILKYAKIRPSALQVEVHPYYQNKKLREFCRRQNILVIGYAPLGSKEANNYFSKIGLPSPPTKSLGLLDDPLILELATKYNKTSAQIILRFLHQLHVVIIPKSTNLKRIKENSKIFDFDLIVNDTRRLKLLDRGKDGKIYHLLNFAEDMKSHPEYPFPELLEVK